MKEYYVILTGSKNNAGDYLIKYRAKRLFSTLRPDRDIIDLNAWEPFDNEKLEIVNGSNALILTGGPSLRKNMYPSIYRMTEDLNDIKVPILTLGIGWKSLTGDWSDTENYPLSPDTLKLINRIEQSGFKSSVRDFHSQNVLRNYGFNSFLMTGCPALYDLNSMGSDVQFPSSIKKVAFSLGVSFVESSSMKQLVKSQILRTRDFFNESEYIVVFHHSLEHSKLKETYGDKQKNFMKQHDEMVKWLEGENISYVDISGSEEGLINLYSSMDVHIGYRVHAHIFMTSISKLSVLLAEDGRGKALHKVIGKSVYFAFNRYGTHNLFERGMRKIFNIKLDKYKPSRTVINDVFKYIDGELVNKGENLRNIRSKVDANFLIMKEYFNQLP